MRNSKPIIGISACLTNSIVRYDAKSQYNKLLTETLLEHFHLLPICPEFECGLGVPRAPIELVACNESICILGRDDKTLDVTTKLMDYTKSKVKTLSEISGYVFKARSPSCGVGNVPVYSLEGKESYYTNGVFVSELIKRYPNLPVIDDSMLDTEEQVKIFIKKALRFLAEA